MFVVIFLGFSSYTFSDELSATINKPLIICAEDAGWPPFSIPSSDGKKKFQGFNLGLLNKILNKHNIDFKVVNRPWKRCLSDGRIKDVNIVLDAAKNPQRERDYLLTSPIYSLTPILFHNIKHSNKFLRPMSPKSLKSLDLICGQKGYTFNNFGLKNSDVKPISTGIYPILELVRKDRCTIGLSRKEVLLSELLNYEHSELIKIQNIKGASKENFYWLLNKNFSYSKELQKLINSELVLIKRSGFDQKLLNRFYVK